MTDKIVVDIEKFIAKVQKRVDLVIKDAIQQVVLGVTVPKAQGGRMPVDTGFLRNSMVAAIGTYPVGPSTPDADPMGVPPTVSIMPTVNRWDLTDPLYIGFSANYARHQEAINGFIEAEVQRWPQVVRESIDKLAAAGNTDNWKPK